MLRLDVTSVARRDRDGVDSCSIGFGRVGIPRNGDGGVIVLVNGEKGGCSEFGEGGLVEDTEEKEEEDEEEKDDEEEDEEMLGVDVEEVETVAAEVGGAPNGVSREGDGGEEIRDEEKAEE